MTAVSDPTQPRHAAAAPPAPRELLRAATTPRKLRRLLVGLVVLCLIWGAVTAWVVSQRASGAADVVSTSEPVSLDGQQIYRALSDADATAATAFLSGGLEPIAARHRYQADIAQAASRLEAATAVAGHSAAARDLAALSAALPVYAGEVETARADNRLGLPLGAAYLREASSLMRGTLLPAAIPGPSLRLLAAFMIIFLVVLLAMTLLASAVSRLVKRAGLGMVDRTLGAAFGMVRGLAIVMLAVLLAGMTTLPKQPEWQHAMLSAPLEALANVIKVWLPNDFSKHINYE